MVRPNDPDRGNTNSLSPLYAGNMLLDRLNTALRLSDNRFGSTVSQDQMYWSTDARPASSRSKEVIRLNMIGPRLVNCVSFAIPVFPHDLFLEYLDEDDGNWKPCLDARSADATPCRQSTRESIPSVIPSASMMRGHVHPQHNFAGHWRSLAFKFRPVFTTALRFILQRTTEGRAPLSVFGSPIDYSLGMRDIIMGFQITSRDDVPVTNPLPNSFAEYESFTTSTDSLGSKVDFSIRVNKATHALQSQGGRDTDINLVWRCEPQPIPWAVVNFYVDMRDEKGEPQLIDRFYVDPIYEGANLNLYWSNDEPSGSFDAPTTPLEFPAVNRHDGRGIKGDVLHAGSANKGYLAHVDLDNTAIGFTPGTNWWLGLNLNFKFKHGTQNVMHPILDFGEFDLALSPLGLRLETEHGDNLHINLPDFDPATPLGIVIRYSDKQIDMWVRLMGGTFHRLARISVPLSSTTPSKLRVGAFLHDTSALPDFDLNQLVLKIDEIVDIETVGRFLDDPTPFIGGEETGNALLRYDYTRSLISGSGFVGGVPDRHDELEWEAVARDFLLRKGFLYFPPTKAKYWKFEFCGLTPEPYEVYKPITRNVLTYPVSMWVGPKESPTLEGSVLDRLIPGASSSINLAMNNAFKDSTTRIGTGGNPTGPSPTSARVVWDQRAREDIGNAYWAWSFLPLHSSPRTPRFQARGTHSYEITVVEHTTKLAYFVGLKNIEAYRLDYLSVEDTPQIIEMFHDTSNIDRGNWILTEDHLLSSGEAHYAEVVSKPIQTQRIIRAIQFAAQQSAPKQLLPDDDFADPEHRYWTALGDARLHNGVYRDPTLGTALLVTRSLTRQSFDSIAESLPTWGDIQGTARTWWEIQQGVVITLNQGGVSSPPVTTPSGGRIYVAARVSSSKGLVSPLHLKIVNDDTDEVLVSEEMDVKAGQVTEWYGGFTITDIVDDRLWLWSDFYNTRLGPYLTDSFTRPNATTLTTMDSGQFWSQDSDATSLQIVSNRAKVTTLGQRNWFDSQSLWGTLEVTLGVIGTTGTGVIKMIDFGVGYFSELGTLYFEGFPSGTSGGFGTNPVADDVLRIDILPTHALPADRLPVGTYDPVLSPYALVLYRNGAWVKTLVHSRGVKTLRGIKGRVGQEFKKFSWTPTAYGRILGKVISYLPRTGRGGYIENPPPSEGGGGSPGIIKHYLDNDGNYWILEGSWELNGPIEWPNDDSRSPSVTPLVNDSVMVTDVGTWYGSMHTYVNHIASTEGTGQRHGNILCLDYDHGIYVSYNGSIVDSNGMDYGPLFPGGLGDGQPISVQFVRTAHLKPENRGGYDPEVYPDQLIARISSVIVGRFVGPMLNVWRGTRRGIAGDFYIGARGSTPAYQLDTAISGFIFSPDASFIAQDADNPTWDEISNRGTLTFDDIIDRSIRTNPRLRAELVQHGESTDSWIVDTLSMYVDPILWYFSTDGGYVWYPALDIRNNPNGVLMLPASVTVTNPEQQPGKSLMWKAVSYAPQTHISSLVIRPWYAGILSGITNNVGLANGGPNVMPYDHYGDIRKDARWRSWSRPVPQDWWHSYRMLRNAGQTFIQPDVDLMYPSETNFPSETLFPGNG